jgi:thiosulfate/3-mercaptopyruvate sulfurtransferase
MLIEAGELQQKLSDRGLRILDSRPRPEYAQGHIPGAVWVDVQSWQQLGRKDGGLHDARTWAKAVSPLGIGRDTPVVVYGRSLPDTARVWWTLKYLGLANVTILDGGWDGWLRGQRPTDAAVPAVKVVPFEPKFQADRLEEMGPLTKSLGSGKVVVVDARSTDEFTGKDVRGKRGGHIPGATHLEWKALLGADGRFKSPAELRALFRQRGIRPEQTAVTCCQSGGRASVEAFALELAGYPAVKVFVRGWEQWSADAGAPVEAR